MRLRIDCQATTGVFLLALASGMVCSQSLRAQTRPTPASEVNWQALIDTGRDQFQEPEAQQKAMAKGSLLKAIDNLDRWFATWGANGQRWKKYFDLTALRELVDSDHLVASEDHSRLSRVLSQCHENYPGLELRPVTEFAAALGRYINSCEAAGTNAKAEFADALAVIESTLNAEADEIEDAEEDDSANSSLRFAAAIDRLRRWNQVPTLVAQLDSEYSRPNLLAHVSKDIAAAGIVRKLPKQTIPIHESMGGASVTGTGHVRGNVNFELVPNNHAALFDILVDVQHDSTNVAHAGPASIYNVGHALLQCRKRIMIEERGLMVYPAMSAANLNISITGVGSSRGGLIGRIVRRVAANRAAEEKGSSEAVTAERVKGTLNRRIDQEFAKDLHQTNELYRTQFWLPMVRTDQMPKPFRFSTTIDSLQLVARQASNGRLAAASDPPSLKAGIPMGLRLHESFVTNTFSGMLAGKERSTKEFADLLGSALGAHQKPARPEAEPLQLRLRFDPVEPVALHLSNDTAEIVMRGADFYFEQRWTGIAMNVRVRYDIERDGLGLKLVQHADLEALPAGSHKGDSPTGTELLLREQLIKEVTEILAPLNGWSFGSEGLQLPGPWQAAGTLRVDQFSADQGWLVLGYGRQLGQAAQFPRTEAADARAPAKANR